MRSLKGYSPVPAAKITIFPGTNDSRDNPNPIGSLKDKLALLLMVRYLDVNFPSLYFFMSKGIYESPILSSDYPYLSFIDPNSSSPKSILFILLILSLCMKFIFVYNLFSLSAWIR